MQTASFLETLWVEEAAKGKRTLSVRSWGVAHRKGSNDFSVRAIDNTEEQEIFDVVFEICHQAPLSHWSVTTH